MSKDQSKQVREQVREEEESNGAVDQRIAELAELVAAGCSTQVTSSYVREEFAALVEDIRARSGERPEYVPRQSTTRLKAVSRSVDASAFEFRSDPSPASSSREEGDSATSGVMRVVSLEDARRVLDAIRREESSGEGPREDLQRAIA